MESYKKDMMVYIAFILICIIAQIYICSKKKIEHGLILPAMFFIPSILTFIYHLISDWGFGMNINIQIFLTENIPTLILLLIYFYKARDIKKNKEVDKMKISDL